MPVVLLGLLVYWPGYLMRDRGRLGIYTLFQFAGLVYWAAALYYIAAVTQRIVFMLAWVAVWTGVTGQDVEPIMHNIRLVLLVALLHFILIPLNWITCAIGAMLGSIASCSQPYPPGEAPPLMVVHAVRAKAVDNPLGQDAG